MNKSLKIWVVIFLMIFARQVFAGLTINTATVTPSTVSPGDSVSVWLEVRNTGNDNWRSSKWTLDGVSTCENHTNHDGNGTYNETFSITAPSSDGTYNLDLVAYENDSCTSGASNSETLSIIVSSGGSGSVSCSSYIGDAVFNEFFRQSQGNNNSHFAEVKLLDTTITSATYNQWSVKFCSIDARDNTPPGQECTTVASLMDKNNNSNPWISFETSHYRYVDLNASPAGMEATLFDENGDVIDYFSSGYYSTQSGRKPSCSFVYDTSYPGSNTFDVRRKPDGTGDWDAQTGNSGGSSEDASNDGGGGGATTVSGFACQHASDGSLYTRIAGISFGYELSVSFSEGTDITGDVDVALFPSADCSGTALSTNTIPFSSQSSVTVGDGDAEAFSISSAYKTVSCRVSYNGTDYCSSDTFSIRPASFSLATPALNNSGATGTPVTYAGNSFNLEVTTVAGYDGTISIDASKLEDHNSATPVSGVLAGSFDTVDAVAGTATGGFTYAEVGNFRFLTDAIYDDTYTSADQTGSDCIADSSSNALVGGKVGCLVGVAQSDWVGRFTPHHFEITTTAGSLQNTCGSGSFSYAGTSLGYNADPQLTITAKNSIDAGGGSYGTTANYTGSYDHRGTDIDFLDIPAVTSDGTTNGLDGSTRVTLSANAGSASLVSNNNGTFALSLNAGAFTYDTGGNNLAAPFVPDLGLQLIVTDEDGITGSGAIDIDASAVSLRYGRLYAANSSGSETGNLAVGLQTQYYDGSDWVLNTDDVCTSLTTSAVAISDPDTSDSLAAGDTCVLYGGSCSGGGDTLTASAGEISFDLQAPGSGNTGTLQLTIDVPAYLEYDWTGAGAADPAATVTFGSAAREQSLIFMRDVR